MRYTRNTYNNGGLCSITAATTAGADNISYHALELFQGKTRNKAERTEQDDQRKNTILLVLLGLYHALHSARGLTEVTESFKVLIGKLSPGRFAETVKKATTGFLADFEIDCVSAHLSSSRGGSGSTSHVNVSEGEKLSVYFAYGSRVCASSARWSCCRLLFTLRSFCVRHRNSG